jgi:hypothetical protein
MECENGVVPTGNNAQLLHYVQPEDVNCPVLYFVGVAELCAGSSLQLRGGANIGGI